MTEFTRTAGYFADEGATWGITRSGESVGEIQQNMRNAGNFLTKRWVTCSYDVVIFGDDGQEKNFCANAHGGARKALTAAKQWARMVVGA